MERVLKIEELEQLSGLARMTLYRYSREGRIPGLVRIGPRAIRFRQADIAIWLEGRKPEKEERTQG